MEFNLHNQNLTPLSVVYDGRDASEPSILTVVNTSKHGKRVVLAGEMIEGIGSPDKVQIALINEGIAVSGHFSSEGTFFRLRSSGKKACVYSSTLVDEITRRFNLNFDGKTSISFYEVEYHDQGDTRICFVPIASEVLVAEGTISPFLHSKQWTTGSMLSQTRPS